MKRIIESLRNSACQNRQRAENESVEMLDFEDRIQGLRLGLVELAAELFVDCNPGG